MAVPYYMLILKNLLCFLKRAFDFLNDQTKSESIFRENSAGEKVPIARERPHVGILLQTEVYPFRM
jgi:hypothetical protein